MTDLMAAVATVGFTPVVAADAGEAWRDDVRELPSFVCVPEALEEGECELVASLVAEHEQSAGSVAGGLDESVRRVLVTKVPPSAESDWLYERLAEVIDRCNQGHYGFDLRDFTDDLTIAEYGPGAFYQWHVDLGGSRRQRKLSVSVFLSSPEDYDGGQLVFPEVQAGARDAQIDLLLAAARGTAVIFPSFNLHGVEPVKRGVRRTLLTWVGGPAFR